LQRIDHPTAKDQRFTEGNPSTGLQATRITARFLNMLQEEIAKAIEAAGIPLDPALDNQLSKAIPKLIEIELEQGTGALGQFRVMIQDALQNGGTWTKGYDTYAEMVADAASFGNGILVRVGPTEPVVDKRGIWKRNSSAPDGWSFWAPDTDTSQNERLVAVEDTTAAMEPIREDVKPRLDVTAGGRRIRGGIASRNRRLGIAWDEDLNTIIYGMLELLGGQARVARSPDPNVAFGIRTRNGKYLVKIPKSGTGTFIAGLDTKPRQAGAVPDLWHVIGMGQSEHEGAEAIPPVTAAQTGHAAVRFGRGVRTFLLTDHPNDPENRPPGDFDIVPLTEVVNGGTGETPLAGVAAMLKELVVGPYNPTQRTDPPQILVSFAGRGGRGIRDLDKRHAQDPEGKYYATMLDDVRRAKAWADANGKTYAVAKILWGQGPRNDDYRIDRDGPVLPRQTFLETYAQDLMNFADDADADIRAITGQAGRIPLLTYQTGGTKAGQAQMIAADRHPHIYMVGPHYYTASAINSRYGNPEKHGEWIHWTADAARGWGVLAGKVAGRLLIGREPWEPLRVLSARWLSTTEIEVVFRVPRPPITIDTTFLPPQGPGRGFGLRHGTGDAATAAAAISAVQVTGPDRIKITIATARTGDETLSYGRWAEVAQISAAVETWRDGPAYPAPNGQASKEIVFNGLISAELAALMDEGAFYIDNLTTGKLGAWIVRNVLETGGKTILRGEARDLAVDATFAPGDLIRTRRPLGFGNIRDTDGEVSPLGYGDTSYGRRTGRYPLYNWLCAFQDMEIL
jgi:hypothetical protein